jgi:hypothetical protein
MAIAYSTYNYDNLSALTRDLYVPKLVDNIYDSNIVTHRMLRKSAPFSGGKKVLQPVEYAKPAEKGFMSSDSATLTVGDTAMYADAAFDWVQAYATIRITGKEEALNSGSEQVIDMIEAKMKSAEKALKDLFGSQLYSDNDGSSVTGSNASTDGFIGLQHIIADDRTLGGINSTTETWWDAGSVVDAGTSVTFANLTDSTNAAYIQTLMRNQFGALSIDNDKPTLIVVSQVVFDAYEATLVDQKRFGASDKSLADAGFSNLLYRGTPVVVDSALESEYSGGAIMLNENYIGFRHHRKRNFAFEDFAKPVDKDYAVAKMLWLGALTCSAPRMQGKIYDLPTSYS